MRGSLSIYVHIPFCVRRCLYCDFNTYAGKDALIAPYLDALETHIRANAEPDRPISTIYFGGGTPTYVGADALARTLSAIRKSYKVDTDAEITSEANPSTSDAERFAGMSAAGFNRLSIGVQAFQNPLLRHLGRAHTVDEALAAVTAARQAGFANVNIDLMSGLPGQSRVDWEDTLSRAIDLQVEHLSLYSLSVEPGTPFERLRTEGRLPLPSEVDDAWMFNRGIERLVAAGYEHYEVSNFARPGYRSRHNLVYWHNGEYRGFGAGAASYQNGRRWTAVASPAEYVSKIQRGADTTAESETLPPDQALAETAILGLRLTDGIDLDELSRRFGSDHVAGLRAKLDRQAALGLVELIGNRARLTRRGLLFGNDVWASLLP